jgi:hypothetical protein
MSKTGKPADMGAVGNGRKTGAYSSSTGSTQLRVVQWRRCGPGVEVEPGGWPAA